MIDRILVALDGSPRSAGVLAAAVEIGRRFDAELVPLRVVFIPAEFPPSAHVAGGDPLRTHVIREAEEALSALIASATGVRMGIPVVLHGQPWRAILQAADDLNADLVVVGSHGYHGLDRVLGTTAGKVANLAHRNVLVVHEQGGRTAASATTRPSKA